MKNYESELILLSSWAKGSNKEDMQYFEPVLFKHQNLFEDIRDGATITQLSANVKRYGMNSIAELLGLNSSIYYFVARGEALQEQLERYTAELQRVDPDARHYYIDKLTEINTIINSEDAQPKVTGFKDLFFNELEERQNESNPKYGIKQLDRDTDGLHRGQLVVLSARPGCGKSALALQISNSVIEEGYKVLYFPLEMTSYETFQRMIIQNQICYDSEEAKHPTPQQKVEIGNFLTELEQSNLFSLYYDCNDLTEIERKIKEEKPFLVVIDQLTQVKPRGRSATIRDRYIEVTNALKRIALTENVCIICVHQLNRTSKDQRKPRLENLAESDSVGRDADVVLMLSVDDEEDYKDLKRTELIIEKNRQGRSGQSTLLQFNGARYTFCETAPSSWEQSYSRGDSDNRI